MHRWWFRVFSLDFHRITAKSVDMVEKELLVAITAYNFVCTVRFMAAQRAKLEPRDLSFEGVQDAVLAALPDLDRAANRRQ